MTLFDSTNMMSVVNHVAISVETLRIDNEYSLEKDITYLMQVNL